MLKKHDRLDKPKEDDGLYAIQVIEENVQRIAIRTFLAHWEVERLMTAMAYQQEIPLTPNLAIAFAIQQIGQMIEVLVEKTRLTLGEIHDLMITVC